MQSGGLHAEVALFRSKGVLVARWLGGIVANPVWWQVAGSSMG